MTISSFICGVRRRPIFSLIAGVLYLLVAQTGSAAPLTYAAGFNVFTLGSLHSESDIGGRAAAGTTLSGSFEVGTHLASSPAQFDLVAGVGVESGSQVKVNSAGKAFVPNGVGGANVLMNGGGALVTGGASPIDFGAAATYFYQLSGGLAALDATGFFSNGSIQASGSGLNVFNITAAEFLNLSSISTAGGTVVINVSGAPGLSNQNMTVDGQQNSAGKTVASKVLFNFFEDAGTLNLPNAMGGSVLAPFATVAGTYQFNGTIVANALNFQGEIHGDGEFDGDPLTPTPEPASVGIAAVGLFLVAGTKFKLFRWLKSAA